MTRFSLTNYFQDINRAQFDDYTKAFTELLQESTGLKCRASVVGLANPKAGTTAEEAWSAAQHVEVFVQSANDDKVLGSIEFKGCAPKRASFHVREDRKEIQSEMFHRYPHAIRGHGYASHTDGTQYSLAY